MSRDGDPALRLQLEREGCSTDEITDWERSAGFRRCGSCTLCCKTHPIPALNKPPAKWCQHAGRGGCAVYATRPEPCSTYYCFWRRDPVGLLRDDERPDRLGVVFQQAEFDPLPVIDALQSYPGAALRPRARTAIERFLKFGWCVVVRDMTAVERGVLETPDGVRVPIFERRNAAGRRTLHAVDAPDRAFELSRYTGSRPLS